MQTQQSNDRRSKPETARPTGSAKKLMRSGKACQDYIQIIWCERFVYKKRYNYTTEKFNLLTQKFVVKNVAK